MSRDQIRGYDCKWLISTALRLWLAEAAAGFQRANDSIAHRGASVRVFGAV
jgi:hypothetical protein